VRSQHGYSLIELAVALGVVATGASIATPRLLAAVDELNAAAAAQYVASVLQGARMEAALRRADVGVRFTTTVQSTYLYAEYVDGNGNGVRSRDIANGTDREVRAPERLSDRFPAVEFGTLPGLPAVDSSSSPPGSDPIKLGSSNIATFSSAGTSSSGSVYILGRHDTQFVVRLFGETGKTRILKFNRATRQWKPL
jgi:prepilin-type N-terminal cleavage/methylation domain-containing protein